MKRWETDPNERFPIAIGDVPLVAVFAGFGDARPPFPQGRRPFPGASGLVSMTDRGDMPAAADRRTACLYPRLRLKNMCSACDRVFAARGGPLSPPVGPLQADREAHRGLAHPSISAANPFLRQSLPGTRPGTYSGG